MSGERHNDRKVAPLAKASKQQKGRLPKESAFYYRLFSQTASFLQLFNLIDIEPAHRHA
jgi:hypothetical protein